MNTIEDAKKLRWILYVLQAKLPEDSQVKIKTEIVCLDQEMSSETNLLRYFDIKNTPLIWAEITILEPDALYIITIVISENSVSLQLKESVEGLVDKQGKISFWGSYEIFRPALDRIYRNILQYKSGEGAKTYANILQYLHQKN